MAQEAEQELRERSRGKDELNLAEFPLSIIGKRAPGGAKTIYFSDQVWDKGAKKFVDRKLTVTASDLMGLPTAIDDEVLVGCMKITRDQGFKDPKVLFTPYEFLELIGWRRDGKSYKRLSQSLDRWAGTLVISDNAFWHKGRQKWVKDTINIIDRVRFFGSGETDAKDGKKSWFHWGNFMWESFEAGNLRSLDFEYWKSLERPVSKRLFRLLQKKFHFRGRVAMPLNTLAFEKVGLSRNMHTGQIKAKLKPGHEELRQRGFCDSEYVSHGRGDWEVVYTDLRKAPTREANPEKHQLEVELERRGIENAAELVRKASVKRIEEAIENFDDRLRNGEDVGPGWLGKCITHRTPFGFRKGYQSKRSLEKKALAKTKQQKAEIDAKRKAESERQAEVKKTNDAFNAFVAELKSYGTFDRFVAEAFQAMPMFEKLYSDKVADGDLSKAKQLGVDAARRHWESNRIRKLNYRSKSK